MAGTSIEQQGRKLWGEVGLGATYAKGDKWSYYGEAGYSRALAATAKNNYIPKGTVSLRYRW